MSELAETKMKTGFKQTEVGLIPEDWEVIKLGDFIKLKNGFAFKSEYFSKTGPIVMTPGNFKLEGGLKFEERKTIRFSGAITKQMCFENGDLIMVMTDLTPDCNLLGKSGIVESNETLLHNQRIGKIDICKQGLTKEYLNIFFNSFLFSERMKSTATGSTVRHTSVPSIVNTLLSLPPLHEQKAIATALSDVDAYLQSLEALIAKKKAIKEGAMQELLGFGITTGSMQRSAQPTTPRKRLEGFSGEWVEKRLGEVSYIKTGSRNNQDKIEDGLYPFFVRSQSVERINTYSYDCEAILVPGEGGIGSIFHYINGKFEVHQRVYKISDFIESIYGYYVFLQMKFSFGKHAMTNSVKATVDSLRLPTFQEFKINFPPTLEEQKAIAKILSDMDLEIESLERKKEKYEEIKQGMMQELLTGKTRLI